MGKILATGVRNVPHIAVFDEVVEDRFANLDLSPLLVYMIDTVPASALPYLAKQFDVLGVKGWKFCKTEQAQRDLLKKAIELHRYKGTPWAIKEAVKVIGLNGCEIEEHVGQYYNGSVSHNGTIQYSAGNWANFRVTFDLGNNAGISAEQTDDLIALINEYKNERSHLVDVSFIKNITENMPITDELTLEVSYSFTDEFSGIRYNGTATYNGAARHDAYAETITITS